MNKFTIKRNYDKGLWDSQLVQLAVIKGVISQNDADEITGIDLSECTLKQRKTYMQEVNKTLLEEYLKKNPITWTDGKLYGVTYEDQQEMTLNLSQYQLEISSGVKSPKLKWHSLKDICTEWSLEDFTNLYKSIISYVKPFIEYKDKIKQDIYSSSTIEELINININYSNI